MESGGIARRLECLENWSCRFKIKVSTEQIPSNSHPDPVPQRTWTQAKTTLIINTTKYFMWTSDRKLIFLVWKINNERYWQILKIERCGSQYANISINIIIWIKSSDIKQSFDGSMSSFSNSNNKNLRWVHNNYSEMYVWRSQCVWLIRENKKINFQAWCAGTVK